MEIQTLKPHLIISAFIKTSSVYSEKASSSGLFLSVRLNIPIKYDIGPNLKGDGLIFEVRDDLK